MTLVTSLEEYKFIRNLRRKQLDGSNGKQLKQGKHQRSGITEKLYLATSNVRGFSNEEIELCREFKRRKIIIATITETKKRLRIIKDLKRKIGSGIGTGR